MSAILGGVCSKTYWIIVSKDVGRMFKGLDFRL